MDAEEQDGFIELYQNWLYFIVFCDRTLLENSDNSHTLILIAKQPWFKPK